MEGSLLDSSGFFFYIGLFDVYFLRMWVEKYLEKESEVCMFVF